MALVWQKMRERGLALPSCVQRRAGRHRGAVFRGRGLRQTRPLVRSAVCRVLCPPGLGLRRSSVPRAGSAAVLAGLGWSSRLPPPRTAVVRLAACRTARSCLALPGARSPALASPCVPRVPKQQRRSGRAEGRRGGGSAPPAGQPGPCHRYFGGAGASAFAMWCSEVGRPPQWGFCLVSVPSSHSLNSDPFSHLCLKILDSWKCSFFRRVPVSRCPWACPSTGAAQAGFRVGRLPPPAGGSVRIASCLRCFPVVCTDTAGLSQ